MEKFSDRLKKLRLEVKSLSQDKIAEALNKALGKEFKRTTISNYETGISEPNFETLVFLAKFFNTTTDYLLGISDERDIKPKNAGDSVKYFEPYNVENKPTWQEPETVYIDTNNHEYIPVTDLKAAAGSGYINHINIDEENTFSLPSHLLKSGKHLAIRIKGDSMSPTMQDGGYAIVRHVERSEWAYITDERVYVVSDKEGHTYLKRCRNRFQEHGFIVLTSDNPDKASYPNFNLQEDELNSIWYVEWYFTAKMPNVHDDFYSRVKRLEDMIHSQAEELGEMKRQLISKKLLN